MQSQRSQTKHVEPCSLQRPEQPLCHGRLFPWRLACQGTHLALNLSPRAPETSLNIPLELQALGPLRSPKSWKPRMLPRARLLAMRYETGHRRGASQGQISDLHGSCPGSWAVKLAKRLASGRLGFGSICSAKMSRPGHNIWHNPARVRMWK